MKVAFYLRVSGNSQIDGDGFTRQNESCLAFSTRNGLDVLPGVFKDEGVSGTVEGMDRPALCELLTRAEVDGIEAIVIERMDRLARDLMISELILAECRKRNLKIFSADQGVLIDMASDGGDPTRVLIRQIMGALAQWEKANLVIKLASARLRKKQETGRCEGSKPYGNRPAEIQILEIIEKLHDTVSPEGIAEMLNDGDFKTRKKSKWTARSVSHIISVKFKNQS